MNKVLRGTLFEDQCNFFLLDATELIQELKDQRNYSPTAIAALGRSTMITAIMGISGKDDQKVSTVINGGGAIGSIIVTANAKGEVKGKVTNSEPTVPKVSNTKLNVGALVGVDGFLTVTKDLGMREPFSSSTPLRSGEIAEDYTHYFASSEQVPTAIAAGVLVDLDQTIKNASCFVVQLLPDASEEAITKLETFFEENKSITHILNETTAEEFLETNFKDEYKVLKEEEIVFKCNCSKEKFISGIQLLEPKEILEIKQDQEIECICEFCHKKYLIKAEEI